MLRKSTAVLTHCWRMHGTPNQSEPAAEFGPLKITPQAGAMQPRRAGRLAALPNSAERPAGRRHQIRQSRALSALCCRAGHLQVYTIVDTDSHGVTAKKPCHMHTREVLRRKAAAAAVSSTLAATQRLAGNATVELRTNALHIRRPLCSNATRTLAAVGGFTAWLHKMLLQ